MDEKQMEEILRTVEEMLEKYGAVPADDVDKKRRDKLGLRPSFRHGNTYYRTEWDEIDGVPVVLIYGIDDPAYASVGIDDALTAFPADIPKEKMDEEVRLLLEEE